MIAIPALLHVTTVFESLEQRELSSILLHFADSWAGMDRTAPEFQDPVHKQMQ